MMGTTGVYETVDIEAITVPKGRQRTDDNPTKTAALADSISRHGQLQPIGVTKDLTLVYGERRIKAKRLLGHDHIDVQYVEEESVDSKLAMEFEENFHRSDLSWQDQCSAVANHYTHMKIQDPDWSAEKTGICLGVGESTVHRYIQLGIAVQAKDEQILQAPTQGAAWNVLERRRERRQDLEMENLEETMSESDVLGLEESSGLDTDSAAGGVESQPFVPSGPRPASKDVLQEDFRRWVCDYEGPRFNFIHCDFPYGIGHDKSDQGATILHQGGAYEDSEDVYWSLLDAFLQNAEKFIQDSAHIMFWLSMKNWAMTIKAFEAHDFNVCPYPLIWYKTDNVGVLPRPEHWPRNICEYALLITRGDRKVVKATSNIVPWPADKARAKHPSEKPEPMLSEFFRMFVDSSTIMLDPTCGAGSSLVAAQAKWALRVMGLDLSEEHVHISRSQLNTRRMAMAGLAGQDEEEEEEGDDLDFDLEDLEEEEDA